MLAVTEKQLGLLHHTLGVRPDRRDPYRNYFLAGPGRHDQADLEALEAAGMMARSAAPAFCPADDIVFRTTEEGRAFALDNLPQPPKLTRYGEYMDADTGLSFTEYLGIRLPRVDWNYETGEKCRYRYTRLDWHYSIDVQGEWKPTKKAAKESYKEALARYHGKVP